MRRTKIYLPQYIPNHDVFYHAISIILSLFKLYHKIIVPIHGAPNQSIIHKWPNYHQNNLLNVSTDYIITITKTQSTTAEIQLYNPQRYSFFYKCSIGQSFIPSNFYPSQKVILVTLCTAWPKFLIGDHTQWLTDVAMATERSCDSCCQGNLGQPPVISSSGGVRGRLVLSDKLTNDNLSNRTLGN